MKTEPKVVPPCNHDSLHFEQFGQKLVCDECQRIYFIQDKMFALNDFGYAHLTLSDLDVRQNPMRRVIKQ